MCERLRRVQFILLMNFLWDNFHISVGLHSRAVLLRIQLKINTICPKSIFKGNVMPCLNTPPWERRRGHYLPINTSQHSHTSCLKKPLIPVARATSNIQIVSNVKCLIMENIICKKKNQTKVETLWENISEDTKVEGNRNRLDVYSKLL